MVGGKIAKIANPKINVSDFVNLDFIVLPAERLVVTLEIDLQWNAR